MGLNQTDTFMVLAPQRRVARPDKEWLIGELRKVIDGFPGIAYNFTQPIDMRVSEMLTGSRGDVAIKIFGPDLATLNRLAGDIEVVEKVPGASGRVHPAERGRAVLARGDRPRRRGPLWFVGSTTLRPVLRTQLEGEIIGTIQQQGRRIPLQLRGAAACATSPDALAGDSP